MSTPKRPRSHTLETESRQSFESAIPSGWVYRRKEDDYGIDGEVELFDDAGKTTGLLFYVQLKATDSTDRDIRIRVETGNYYTQLDAPVLLVRFMASTRTLYGRWFGSFMRPTDRRTTKTATVKITSRHELIAERLRLLARHAETFRALRSTAIKRFEFGVVIAPTDNGLPADLTTRLMVHAQKTKSLVKLRLKDAESSPLQIVIDGQQIRVLVCEANGFTFDLPEGYDASTDELAATILSATGFAVAWHGATREGAIIVAEHVGESLLLDVAESCVLVGRLLHGGGALDAALQLADQLCNHHTIGPDPTCVLLPFLQDSGLATSSRSALASALKSASSVLEAKHGATENAAVASYNAGNQFRRVKEVRQAFRAYLRAARLRPGCLDQSYFLREAAGLAYLNRRFRLSANLYKALVAMMPESNLIPLLLSDALLLAGRPEQAIFVIDEIEGELTVDDSSFMTLIRGVCAHVINTTEFGEFSRTVCAEELSRFDSTLPDTETEALSLGILSKDPLSALAWFNLGGVQHRRGDLQAAGWSWLTAARICPTDIEAYVNALIAFKLAGDFDIAAVVMQQAFAMFGADFVTAMQRRVPDDDNAHESTAALLQAYEDMSDLRGEKAVVTSLEDRHDSEAGFDLIDKADD